MKHVYYFDVHNINKQLEKKITFTGNTFTLFIFMLYTWVFLQKTLPCKNVTVYCS